MSIGLSIPSYVSWANVQRFGKMLPYYLCDGSIVQQEALERIVKGTKDATGKYVGGAGYRNLGSTLRKSILKTEQAYKQVLAKNDGSFWKYAGKTLKDLPSEVSSAWSTAGKAAKAAGKSSLWGSIKGASSAIGKKIPLIGSLIFALTEIPNIYRATVDGGLVSGAAETVKAVGRMSGFTAGAAIGQALIPIPVAGAIVGGIVGEKLASMITGKSYSEQKEEIKKETLAEAEVQQTHQEAGSKERGSEEEEYLVENPFGGTLTNKQLAQLQDLQNQIIKNDSTFNVSA